MTARAAGQGQIPEHGVRLRLEAIDLRRVGNVELDPEHRDGRITG